MDKNRQDDAAVAANRPRRWVAIGVVFAAGAALAVTLAVLLRDDRPATDAEKLEQAQRSIVDESVLDAAERKYLWDVEHHVLLLKKHGLAKLSRAIRDRDQSAFRAALAGDFRARKPDPSAQLTYRDESVEIARATLERGRATTISGYALANWLGEYRDRFAKEPIVKFAVLGAAPAQRERFDGPWQVQCELHIRGQALWGGPSETVIRMRLTMAQPTRERLAAGGWLQACTIEQVLDGHAPRYLMEEVAARRGIDTTLLHDNWRGEQKAVHSGGIYVCDYNRDGCLDLLINDLDQGYRLTLYQGSPTGQFTDVTREQGLALVRGATPVVFVDLDGDGWEDLIVGEGNILANQQGTGFRDVTSQSNFGRVALFPSSIAVADYDRDGRMDLYVSRGTKQRFDQGSWLDGDASDAQNQLLRNVGDWQFEDVTAATGAGGGKRSTFTSVWLDANSDGRPDLYVIHEFGNGVLLVNQPDNTFKSQPLVEGQSDFGSMGLTAGDVDNDGHVDLFVANMYSKSGQRIMRNLRSDAYQPSVMKRLRSLVAGSQLYRNLGELKFERVAAPRQVDRVGWSWGAVLADLNNDGWLDLYATCGFMSRAKDKPDG
ncbi:MAG: VCBS repeat-containing protein [Planctomycetes bacterium]|nr:VCBS repeat-containing protein [Planctomycetota bacterium]